MLFRTYRRDVNPFETDTTGKLFVVDVSINWPSKRNWQTKVLDSGKATQLNLLCQKNVKRIFHKIMLEKYFPVNITSAIKLSMNHQTSRLWQQSEFYPNRLRNFRENGHTHATVDIQTDIKM